MVGKGGHESEREEKDIVVGGRGQQKSICAANSIWASEAVTAVYRRYSTPEGWPLNLVAGRTRNSLLGWGSCDVEDMV